MPDVAVVILVAAVAALGVGIWHHRRAVSSVREPRLTAEQKLDDWRASLARTDLVKYRTAGSIADDAEVAAIDPRVRRVLIRRTRGQPVWVALNCLYPPDHVFD